MNLQAYRRRQGRQNHQNGLVAEDCIAREYERQGAEILARRHRGPGGELDVIARDGDILVFVEVKRRKFHRDSADLVTARQWQRLAESANHYMMTAINQTGAIRGCRFDLAIIGPDSVPRIIRNARSFDEH